MMPTLRATAQCIIMFPPYVPFHKVIWICNDDASVHYSNVCACDFPRGSAQDDKEQPGANQRLIRNGR